MNGFVCDFLLKDPCCQILAINVEFLVYLFFLFFLYLHEFSLPHISELVDNNIFVSSGNGDPCGEAFLVYSTWRCPAFRSECQLDPVKVQNNFSNND